VDSSCWQEDPDIVQYSKESKLSMPEILIRFESQVVSIVKSYGKIPMLWEDFFEQTQNYKPSKRIARGELLQRMSTTGRRRTSNATSTEEILQDIRDASLIQPWKCWNAGSLPIAVRSATVAHEQKQPVVMSACWYLDWNDDWSQY
jgi:hypothetical protein